MMNPQQAGPGNIMPNQNQPGVMPQQQQQPPVNMPNQPLIRPQNAQQMNQMNQMQMGPVAGAGVKSNPQMNMGANQMMQGNMMVQNQMPVQGNMPNNQQMNPMQMNQNQMMMMLNQPNNPNMMGVRPNMQPNPMVNQMGMGPQQQGVVPPNQMMNSGQQMQMNMQQMRQKEMLMPNQPAVPFPPVRSVTPNFIRQSPSPMSVPSPIGMASHGISSPAMVPSPQAPMSNAPRMSNVMAPSPSAPMNTPGQPQAVQSPMNPADDQIYREKYNRLTKYKEPLKKMISRVGSDGINSEKITKLKKLLEILSNPDTRIPLETLVKCEIVLENQFGALKDPPAASINNPLYDAIVNNLQTPLGNHMLHRTFKPSLEAWFGPDIKNLPPSKKRRLSEDQVVPVMQNEISHILQREIARLDSKFKISVDQTAHSSASKMVALMCTVDDKQLPPVPPIHIVIPEDYPSVSPQCNIIDHEFDDTPFLIKVKRALKARISKLPATHSLTHILETWCLAIRQACSPNYVEPTQESVLLAV
jgi:mediator of RNA polymerase II transcription subunit 15